MKKVSQQEFANAVIDVIKNSTTPLETKGHSQVPDNWTSYQEGDKGGYLCLVHHGFFDTVYKRTAIEPQGWNEFCQQYYTPVAKFLLNLYQSAKSHRSPLLWDGEVAPFERDDFPMNGHFWFRKQQDASIKSYLDALKEKGLITKPNRKNYECEVVGLRYGDRIIDIPVKFWDLRNVVDELINGEKYSGNYPCREISLYDETVPVLYMLADKIEAKDELTKLVEEKNPEAKLQSISFVFADKTGETITPRLVGSLTAHILEIYSGTVAGAILYSYGYRVPNNLTEEEKESIDCDNSNWESHHKYIIKNHPKLEKLFAE